MSAGAYLLVKFNDKQKLVSAVDTLYNDDTIINYDAIDGHYHLLLKLSSLNNSSVEAIKKLDGFSEMSECIIEKDNQTVFDLDEEFTYSYLFIEANTSEKEAVLNTLLSKEAVTFCSPTNGSFNLIAQLKTETFDKADRFVKTEIKNLDGILRYKQDHVIFLDRI